MFIYFDLETVGTEDAAAIAEIATSITAPGNISKAETLAAWEAEKKPALIEEAVKKTSFDGGLGRIVCIGWALNDGDPQCVHEGTETDLITAFFGVVKQAVTLHYQGGKTDRVPVFVGHNISGFDLRFLWQRTVVRRIKPPPVIPFHVKPWDKGLADTMVMWNPEREKRVSLDRLCRTLGIESPKTELDGGKVWEYVKAGRISEVADYCKRDVTAIRECYRRMTFL